MNKYLPIGSIVLLKNATKRLMIYGRMQIKADTGKTFDYAGCLYPEGNVSEDYTFFFNNENIDKVIFKGFSDEEEEKFTEFLSEIEGNESNSHK